MYVFVKCINSVVFSWSGRTNVLVYAQVVSERMTALSSVYSVSTKCCQDPDQDVLATGHHGHCPWIISVIPTKCQTLKFEFFCKPCPVYFMTLYAHRNYKCHIFFTIMILGEKNLLQKVCKFCQITPKSVLILTNLNKFSQVQSNYSNRGVQLLPSFSKFNQTANGQTNYPKQRMDKQITPNQKILHKPCSQRFDISNVCLSMFTSHT